MLLPPFSETNLLPRVPTFPYFTPSDVTANESLDTQLHKNTQQPNSKPSQNTERIPHITYLTFFLANARSLLPKIDELKATLQTNEVSLAFITETWLIENVDDGAVQLSGFSSVRRDRLTRIGGGVCAYIDEHIAFKFLTDLHNDNFESL